MGGVIVAVLLGWALWPEPEEVDLATVTSGALLATLDEEGETRVRQRFVVSAPVAGRLLRIQLEPGDPVEAGRTELAVFQPRDPSPLDPRSRAEAEAEVRTREAELERARHERDRAAAELEFARRDCERDRRLAEREVLSLEQLERSELAERSATEGFEATAHAVESASHRLARARARLLNLGNPDRGSGDPISIRSPIDGVVLRRMRQSEAVVAPGEPLLEVGDPRDLEIVADYLSRDAVGIRPGARVIVESWGGDEPLDARVRRVEPSGFTKLSALGVEEQRVNVRIDLVTPASERASLGDGFRVETRVVVSECEDVAQVPAGSLFRREGDWSAFAIVEGRARLRSLRVGVRTPSAVEVIEGLEVGESVILHPSDRIADGTRVVRRTTP